MHGTHRVGGGVDRDLDRVLHELTNEVSDVAVERGREQQRDQRLGIESVAVEHGADHGLDPVGDVPDLVGVDGRGYDRYDHPVQLRIRSIVGELLGVDMDAAPWGMDGCAIPTYGVPLRAAAEGARRWANPSRAGLRDELAAALERVRMAAIEHPRLIAGGGFLDTDLIRGGEGGVVAKQGAEGLCLVGAPGIGLALHTEDGDGAARAGRVATVAALRAAGATVASASALDLHRTVEYPDPRGGAPLARVEPTTLLANLTLS